MIDRGRTWRTETSGPGPAGARALVGKLKCDPRVTVTQGIAVGV